MRSKALLLLVVLLCAAQSAARAESFQSALPRASEAQPASQYSFADLYRLAVAGPLTAFPPTVSGDAPIRTATVQPAAQFSVAEAPEPQPWVLLLSGAALAIWVARRRLGYAY